MFLQYIFGVTVVTFEVPPCFDRLAMKRNQTTYKVNKKVAWISLMNIKQKWSANQ